jgi:hypothetical protein
MRVSTLSLLQGLGGAMLLCAPASGGFLGIEVVNKPNPYGLLACDVFAVFDRPGQDLFLNIAGTPAAPLLIQVIGGTFYQHPMGWDKAPSAALVDLFPSLAFDTFVTIGVKSVGPGAQPQDDLVLTPCWPGFGPSSISTGDCNVGWAVTPGDPQADPFNPDYFAGNGHVLIGQYSTADGTAISGHMVILFRSNGVTQIVYNASFYHVPGPGALGVLATAELFGTRRRRKS